MTEVVFADANHSQFAGQELQSGANLNFCFDGADHNPSSCGDIHHCVNCHDVVLLVPISIDNNDENVTSYLRVRHRQVDIQPHFRPPRIS